LHRRRASGRGDLIRRSGLKQCGSWGFELHGSLHTRFHASGDENPLEAALSELRRVRFERVLARIE
jgi:hypothetical protein